MLWYTFRCRWEITGLQWMLPARLIKLTEWGDKEVPHPLIFMFSPWAFVLEHCHCLVWFKAMLRCVWKDCDRLRRQQRATEDTHNGAGILKTEIHDGARILKSQLIWNSLLFTFFSLKIGLHESILHSKLFSVFFLRNEGGYIYFDDAMLGGSAS